MKTYCKICIYCNVITPYLAPKMWWESSTHFTLWHTIAEMWGHMTTLMPEVACLLHLNWKSQCFCEKRREGKWWFMGKSSSPFKMDSQEASFSMQKEMEINWTFFKHILLNAIFWYHSISLFIHFMFCVCTTIGI